VVGDGGSEGTVSVLRGDVTFRLARMKGTEPMLSAGTRETIVSPGLAASSRGFSDAHQSNPLISTLQLLRTHSIKVRTDVAARVGPRRWVATSPLSSSSHQPVLRFPCMRFACPSGILQVGATEQSAVLEWCIQRDICGNAKPNMRRLLGRRYAPAADSTRGNNYAKPSDRPPCEADCLGYAWKLPSPAWATHDGLGPFPTWLLPRAAMRIELGSFWLNRLYGKTQRRTEMKDHSRPPSDAEGVNPEGLGPAQPRSGTDNNLDQPSPPENGDAVPPPDDRSEMADNLKRERSKGST
jgi:hypothetical protein